MTVARHTDTQAHRITHRHAGTQDQQDTGAVGRSGVFFEEGSF